MLKPRTQAPVPVGQSVIDRLMNEDPKFKSDIPQTPTASLRQFKNGLRRDLEWLLNTRSIADPPAEEFKELNRSVYVYGFPDLSAFSTVNPKDRERLQRAIHSVVRLFERRIGDAQVVLLEHDDNSNTLRFRIEGMLRTEPMQPVSFDTVLQLSSGRCEVRRQADA
ncbi:MAG: type VI secretion system baseplate subunit TssE [Bryobacteraceae bacterium]